MRGLIRPGCEAINDLKMPKRKIINIGGDDDFLRRWIKIVSSYYQEKEQNQIEVHC